MLNRGTNKLVDKDKLKIRVGEKTHEPNTGKSREESHGKNCQKSRENSRGDSVLIQDSESPIYRKTNLRNEGARNMNSDPTKRVQIETKFKANEMEELKQSYAEKQLNSPVGSKSSDIRDSIRKKLA